MLTITLDFSCLHDFAEKLNALADGLPAACSRAVYRAGDMTATAMARELAEETGLGVRDVREQFEIMRATPDGLVYEITIKSHPTTLGEFDPRQTRFGVSARPWGQRRVFPGTFMWRDLVFHRVGKERLPIEPLYGPDPAREALRGETIPIAKEVAADALKRRLIHEIGRILPKKGGVSISADDSGDTGESDADF